MADNSLETRKAEDGSDSGSSHSSGNSEKPDEEDEDAQLAADLAGDGDDIGAELAGAAEEDEDAAADEDDDEEMADDDDEEADDAGDDGADDGAVDAADDGAAAMPKRRGKPKDLKAPKRPLAGYAQHSAAERLRLKESSPEVIKDLKATAKAIAESWERVPQSTKDEMQAVYEKEKAVYDGLMDKYKKTESYRVFQREFATWKDMKMMKKLLKKQKAITPARPKSGYMSFAAKVRGDVQVEFPGIGMGDIGKKIAEKWQLLSAKEQDVFQAAAKTASAKWVVEMTDFRRTEQYRSNIDEQMSLELKQGLRKLKEAYAQKIPKRPPLANQLWAAASGVKGSFVDLGKQFQALSEEQQKTWHEKAEQNRVAFKSATDAFSSSKDGQQLEKLQLALKKKVAITGARKKFLVDAPKKVPGVQVLCTNADIAPGGENARCRAGKWATLSEPDQRFWEEEHARLVAEYDTKMETFRQTDSWKQFERATSGKGFQKRGTKGKAAKGSKGGNGDAKAKPKSTSIKAPESMPQKPPKARAFWIKEQKAGLRLSDLSKQWDDLGAEGQKQYIDQANKSEMLYAAELEKWAKSKDGKKHARALEGKKQKQKELKAREKFLSGPDAPQEPSKPKSPQALFIEDKRTELQKSEPGVGVRELNKMALALWTGLDAEGRKVYESKHKSLFDIYEFDLQAYKQTPAYKKFEKASAVRKRGGAKAKGGRSGAKRRKKDDALAGLHIGESDSGSSDSDGLGLDSDDDLAG